MTEQQDSKLQYGETDQEVPRDPISAFVITFNEEDHIKQCIESLDFCQEVIVVDSFSHDRTAQIAESLGARVIQRAWQGYRDQKAFGLSSVNNEWVLNLDADERVSAELKENIIAALQKSSRQRLGLSNEPVISGYFVNRVVFYLGRWWRQGGWYPEYRLRMFRKSKTIWGGVEPHEKPIVDGLTERIGGELQHFTYRNLDEQLAQLHRFSKISAQEEFNKARQVSFRHLILNPAVRTFKFFILKRGYKEGIAGLIVAMAEGYYVFMKYAKLWELYFNQSQQQHKENSGGDER